MTPDQIRAIAASGESEQVEFKASTGQRSEAARTVCAMLNGKGGYVLFGVSDSGELRGQEVGAHTLEEVVRELRRIEPQPLLSPERVPLENGRELIVISVPGRSGGPFTYDARPYVRVGPTTSIMPQIEKLGRTRDTRWTLTGKHP